jgi:multiple sugar transport system substrate-binding protein
MLEALGAGGVVAISGCLGNSGGGGNGSGGNGSSSGSGGNTVQFLTMGVGDNIEDYFQKNNKAFEKKSGASLEFTSVTWDNAQTTVNNRVDGNKAPDVARWPARWIPQMVGKDALMPLDDLMTGNFLNQFPKGIANGCRYQDHYYGVPWASSNKCLYYNKNIFKKAGLDPENPKLDSWQDMLSAAKTIKNSDSVSKPALGLAGADAIETGSQYYHYHWSYGADLVNDNNQPVVNTSGAVDALSFYSALANKHGVTQSSPLSSTRQDIRQLFESGELGMVIAHVYTGINISQAKEKGKVDFDYGIVQVPKGPAGRYSLNTIDTLAVFNQTKNKDLAYDLINFYFTEKRRFQYSKQKGFLPVTKAVSSRDYFTESKNWAPFVKATQYARARPKLKQFSQFNSRMVQAIQEAVGNQKDPKQALDDAQKDLKSMMSG